MLTSSAARKHGILFTIATLIFVGGGALFVHPGSARAQQTSNPNPAEQFRQMQEVMGPMMRANVQAMMEAMLAVLARKETADQMASFSKNYLDALVAKGFSHEEALRLVAAHAPTLMPGAR